MKGNESKCTRDAMTSRVHDFYERYPYPPPADDVEAYRGAWNDDRRRADALLFWPFVPYRNDRSILVAGCGTSQAAHYAVRWPNARVVGIDVSAASLAFENDLKRNYGLDNLELHELPVERASELGEAFDHVVCTGVLHHLPDPDAGLRALQSVLTPRGALYLMVYAPYGRAGIYMLQDYCRRVGAGTSDDEIVDLAASLRALSPDHPIVPLLRNSPDFATASGLADALLHPNDRAYSVPQLFDFVDRAGLTFGRWLRQAPYNAACGAVAFTPHAMRLSSLPMRDQYAAMELFRGTMVRHNVVAYASSAAAAAAAADFDSDAWLRYIPVRLPDTIAVQEKLPPGASAVLINRGHTFTDLYLPIDAVRERFFAGIDGRRPIGEIVKRVGNGDDARSLFKQLWLWDQVVFGR
jgi:SAM-dependent methyltransferase